MYVELMEVLCFINMSRLFLLRSGYKSISGVTRCQGFSGFCKCSQKHQAIKFLKRMPKWICYGSKVDMTPGFAFSNTLKCLMFFFCVVPHIRVAEIPPWQYDWPTAINRLSIYWIVPSEMCKLKYTHTPEVVVGRTRHFVPGNSFIPPGPALHGGIGSSLTETSRWSCQMVSKILVQAPVGRRSDKLEWESWREKYDVYVAFVCFRMRISLTLWNWRGFPSHWYSWRTWNHSLHLTHTDGLYVNQCGNCFFDNGVHECTWIIYKGFIHRLLFMYTYFTYSTLLDNLYSYLNWLQSKLCKRRDYSY